jgi:hypothetical protein
MLMIFSYWFLTARTICAYPLLLYGCEKKSVLICILFCFMDARKKKCVLQVKILLSDGHLDEKSVSPWCYQCSRCVAWKGGVS